MKSSSKSNENISNNDKPLVSIITVVLNNVDHVKGAIESVLSQNYPRIECIVIDGGSTDGSIEVLAGLRSKISIFISEKDGGIYDAINKGIKVSSGDLIALLHSDDLYCDNYVVSAMVDRMDEMGSELCFSDMVIVDRNKNSIVRYYMASYFRQWMFRVGWLPPHPTILLKRSIFSEFGMYSTEYKLAGDFDFLVRIFYARKIDWSYLNRITVMMRAGGASNDGLLSKFRAMIEINRSLRNNGVFSTYFFQLVRYLIRLVELVVRPNINMCSSVNSVLKSPPYNRVLKNSPAEPNIENHQP